jgi:hypothetical protein
MGYQLSENSLFFYVPNGAGSIDWTSPDEII